jgi:hypothetical protein
VVAASLPVGSSRIDVTCLPTKENGSNSVEGRETEKVIAPVGIAEEVFQG